MNTFYSYMNILRPLNLIFSALSVIITAYLTHSLGQTVTIIYAVIVVVTFAGASNILNDIFDININKKNKPHRPLPSGEIFQPSVSDASRHCSGRGCHKKQTPFEKFTHQTKNKYH